MRICLECYAIFCAVICTALTGCLSFNLSDSAIEWVAKKVINISFIVFGPILFTFCLYGLYNLKGLSHICGIHGIQPNSFNGVCIFLLAIVFGISLFVSYSLLMQKTIDMASQAFTNENSMIYRMS